MKSLLEGKTLVWVAVGLLALAGALAMVQPGKDGGTGTAEERRVADILGAIAGAGRVEVALFYAPSSDGLTGGKNEQLTGAVVVADGARDMEVRLNLIRAVRTLLSLPETAVDVFIMEDGG